MAIIPVPPAALAVPPIDPKTGRWTPSGMALMNALIAVAQGLQNGQVPAAFVQLTDGTKISSGTGAPNSAVFGSVPDVFLQRDGAAGSIFWLKKSGVDTDTGWVAVA